MPSSSKYERKSKTNVFHIRIGNNIDKIDLKDPAFLKLLEQQYATKYLQSLGVQSTAKNIYKILKQYPIQNCEIIQSRLNGGLYTDTITIMPKTFTEATQNQLNEKQQVSSEMIQMLDLKRMGEKKYQSQKSNQNQEQFNNRQLDANIDDSMLTGHQTGKKTNTYMSNFRVKSNNTRTNSNAFLMDKNSSMTGQKSTYNLANNYDDLSFPKLSSNKPSIEPQTVNEGLKFISFNLEDIKSRYIFPFNDNFKRKSNYKLQDDSNLIEPEDPKIVYEWKVFHFPFTKVKLSLNTLKQLQSPIQAKMSDISNFLDSFYQQFPSTIFPLSSQAPKQSTSSLTQTNLNSTLINPQINVSTNIKSSQHPSSNIQNPSTFKTKTFEKTNLTSSQKRQTTMLFTKQQVDLMFSIIRSESMVKMIGVFLHLAYWCIFGGVNPVQIQSTMKKKMYIMMFETLEYFKIKVDNKKTWALIVFPMVLLTLKMAAHYFFSLQYTKIFQSQQSRKIGVDDLALDKIMHLVEKMFDQSNINGRFIFLESQITGAKGTFLKDKQFIRNRIFGTSPGLQIILPNPKNGKARAIMAKNINIEKPNSSEPFGKISQIKLNRQGNNNENKQCQQKLLCLALHKINNRLEEIQGHSSEINPIINLKV